MKAPTRFFNGTAAERAALSEVANLNATTPYMPRVFFETDTFKLYIDIDGLGWIEITGSGSGAALTVRELDGAPLDSAVTIIRVPNTSLTDNGAGDVTLSYELAGAVVAHVAEVDPHTQYATVTDIATPNLLIGTFDSAWANAIVVGTTPGGELGGTWASPTVDSVHSGSAHHDPITLAADVDTILGLSTQQLTLDSQSANTVFAGPTSGGAVDPTFRSLVSADLPAISHASLTGLSADDHGQYALSTHAFVVVGAVPARLTTGRQIAAGTGISFVDAGAGSTLTISTTITQYTDEMAQDAIGSILLDSSSIDFTYDDSTPTITAVVLPAGVDHNSLANLTTGDPHTQYVELLDTNYVDLTDGGTTTLHSHAGGSSLGVYWNNTLLYSAITSLNFIDFDGDNPITISGAQALIHLENYASLLGRDDGQVFYGGQDRYETLILSSTADPEKGFVYIGEEEDARFAFDEDNGWLGLGIDEPIAILDVRGDFYLTGTISGPLVANGKIRAISIVIDGGGSAISTGVVKANFRIPFACTINSVTLLAHESGSIVVDIWKDTYANYAPTVADTITAAAKPTISAADKSEDTTLLGWTTSIAAGDTLRFNVDSVTTITNVTLILKVTET